MGAVGNNCIFAMICLYITDAIDISHNGDTLLYYRGGIGFLDLIDRKNISSIEEAPEFPDFFAYELLIAPNDEHFFVSRSPWYGWHQVFKRTNRVIDDVLNILGQKRLPGHWHANTQATISSGRDSPEVQRLAYYTMALVQNTVS